MPQFRNIVLTTDFSPYAAMATPYALELGVEYGATIHLVHVFEDVHCSGFVLADGSMGYDPEVWLKKVEKDRQEQLRALAASITAPENVRLVPHYLRGHPVTEVLKFAKLNNADCIVISTHGRTGLSHLLFGSVAEKIARTSPCPVLSIRPHRVALEQEAATAHEQEASDITMSK